MIQFAEYRYAPVLLQRVSELSAILNLTNAEKASIFPVFRMRPWLTARAISRSPEKLIECMGDLPFAADLDDWWNPEGRSSEAAIDFLRMRSDPNRYWYDFVQGFEQIVPCIRLDPDVNSIIALTQQDWLTERGFGFVLSVKNAQHHSKVPEILAHIPHNNYFVVVDAGWSVDPLQSAARIAATVERIFEINQRAILFVASSSFPDSFGDIGMDDSLELKEYSLVDEVRRHVALRFNDSEVRYSDWATTRPPFDAGGGGTWIPRIDIPGERNIQIFRSRSDENEDKRDTCERIARFIVRQDDWPSPPPSWGHYMVDMTAGAGDFGIYSAQKNTSSRINIHLHNVAASIARFPREIGEEPFEG